MKRIVGASCVLALVVPAAAQANVTRQLRAEYTHAYDAARAQFGARAVGCGYFRRRGACRDRPTVARIEHSLAVIARLYPPAPVVATTTASATPYAVAPDPTPAAVPVGTFTGGGSYEQCIISAESGGSASAQNGQYTGIGQWSPQQWQADGGGQYSSTASGATYSQQLAVLNSEGTSGMYQQQGQYDRCGAP